MGRKSASDIIRDRIIQKKALAEKYASLTGTITKKQFASIAEKSVSGITLIMNSPDFPRIIKNRTPGGKGPVEIPLSVVLWYIEDRMYQIY